MKDYVYKTVNNKKGETLEIEATLYESKTKETKGVLLYYHGGGLLYGHRKDLPNLHLDMLTGSGYSILSFDYRLAPEAGFELILEDVLDSIDFFISNRENLGLEDRPYFLWGRSAGGFLALTAASMDLAASPNAIISYYGYGFTTRNWYNTSSMHYLSYPIISREQALAFVGDQLICQGYVNERFPIYLYARQTGNWISMVSQDREEEFLNKYSLLNLSKEFDFPPVFLAHSTKDKDVPYMESVEIYKIIKNSTLFSCNTQDHDFDRQEESELTLDLLNRTIDFLDSHLG